MSCDLHLISSNEYALDIQTDIQRQRKHPRETTLQCVLTPVFLPPSAPKCERVVL